MAKIAAAHRVSIQRQNRTEPNTLNYPFLLLIPLTLSYLCLSYPQYLYFLAPVGESLCGRENCGRFFRTKKESVRGVERSLQSPAMGVAGYTPNLHHPGIGGVTALCPGSISCSA